MQRPYVRWTKVSAIWSDPGVIRGSTQCTRELVEKKKEAIDPNRVVEKRSEGCGGLVGTAEFTPLLYASW